MLLHAYLSFCFLLLQSSAPRIDDQQLHSHTSNIPVNILCQIIFLMGHRVHDRWYEHMSIIIMHPSVLGLSHVHSLTVSLVLGNCSLNPCKLLPHSIHLFLNGVHELFLPFELLVKRTALILLGLQLLLNIMMARLQGSIEC